ncbi:MAG: hypothetical protein FJY98_03825 [Candidatus Liptonbacteria bacterium]|nr:hypothetical protein [Candidatus Liptonbacteria bacterium]
MKAFDARRRRLWCHGPKPEYEMDEDWADQWYVSARTIALVRPRRDLIILPGGNEQTKEFFAFCAKTLQFDPAQVIWTSGQSYLLDKDIAQEVLFQIRGTLHGGNWEIIPYSVTHPFSEWTSSLQFPIFGDDEGWVARYSDKSILHPHARRALRHTPPLGALIPSLRIPRGYACETREDLLEARRFLEQDGISEFIIKPARGTTGEGIKFVGLEESFETYRFPMGSVVLEERLPIDTDAAGRPISPSIHYFGEALAENVTDQLFGDGVAHEGNLVPSGTSAAFQQELRDMAQCVLSHLKPKGPGGFDFLSVGGKPVLIDPNVGRFTGAHPALIFRNLYAPGASFQCWKVKPKGTVWGFWETLRRKGLSFNTHSQKGVFPLCYLPEMWGMLAAFGETREAVMHLRDETMGCF